MRTGWLVAQNTEAPLTHEPLKTRFPSSAGIGIGFGIRHGFRNLCRCDAATDASNDAVNAERDLYDLPAFEIVSLLHMTDCHAQLEPTYFREPSANLRLGSMHGQLPHVVGENLLKAAGVRPGTFAAHAYTHIDFEKAVRRCGKVSGFAHLSTLAKRLKASRPGALLLNGGDTGQGSATSAVTLVTNAGSNSKCPGVIGLRLQIWHAGGLPLPLDAHLCQPIAP